MSKYQRGKIYKLTNLTDDVYYGSTISSLRKRLEGHKADYKNYLLGKTKCKRRGGKIIEEGNYKIELVEDFPCNSNVELRMREQEYINNNQCINIRKAYESEEDYYKRKRLQDKKRTRDQKPYLKKYRDYQMSWGGSMNSYECNLLKIELDVFSD